MIVKMSAEVDDIVGKLACAEEILVIFMKYHLWKMKHNAVEGYPNLWLFGLNVSYAVDTFVNRLRKGRQI